MQVQLARERRHRFGPLQTLFTSAHDVTLQRPAAHGADPVPDIDETVAATRTRSRPPRERGGIRPQTAWRPAASGSGVPQYVFRGDVEPRTADRLQAVQCRAG